LGTPYTRRLVAMVSPSSQLWWKPQLLCHEIHSFGFMKLNSKLHMPREELQSFESSSSRF
jgi:hypothetical protein